MTQRRIYQTDYPYFVTFNVRDGLPFFEETKYAKLLSKIIFNAGKLKGFDVLAYQIMPEHMHLLTWQKHTNRIVDGTDRTLENVRSVGVNYGLSSESTLSRMRPITRVRSGSFNISDLLQSIKGNFSRKIHEGNIWQKRFYTR